MDCTNLVTVNDRTVEYGWPGLDNVTILTQTKYELNRPYFFLDVVHLYKIFRLTN